MSRSRKTYEDYRQELQEIYKKKKYWDEKQKALESRIIERAKDLAIKFSDVIIDSKKNLKTGGLILEKSVYFKKYEYALALIKIIEDHNKNVMKFSQGKLF